MEVARVIKEAVVGLLMWLWGLLQELGDRLRAEAIELMNAAARRTEWGRQAIAANSRYVERLATAKESLRSMVERDTDCRGLRRALIDLEQISRPPGAVPANIDTEGGRATVLARFEEMRRVRDMAEKRGKRPSE